MMRMAVLGSGSSGNATLVQCGDTTLLVDAGLSAKQLCLRMAVLGVEPEQIDGILLTHEHSDHARGVDVFLRKRDIPVYANAMTREALSHKMKSDLRWKIFNSGQDFDIGEMGIHAFRIPHDAAEPVGFVLQGFGTRLSMVSDVGHVTQLMRERLQGSHAIYIEANYDPALLEQDTKRPWGTKQRIASRHGHLSNQQAADLLGEIACDKLRVVMLAHLSSDCNSPELATRAVVGKLTDTQPSCADVLCASAHEPTPWVSLPTPQPPLTHV